MLHYDIKEFFERRKIVPMTSDLVSMESIESVMTSNEDTTIG